MQFPWAQSILGPYGLVYQVKCVICFTIDRKDKFLSPKLDIFHKHVDHCRAMVATSNVAVGNWYYSKDATHNKNERNYMGRNKEFVFNLVQFGVHASSKKSLI